MRCYLHCFLYKREQTVWRIFSLCAPANRTGQHPADAAVDLFYEQIVCNVRRSFGDKSVASVISAVIKIVVLIPTCKFVPAPAKITGGQ